MLGARRRPYVDMVKEGNDADDRPGRNPKGRGDLGASCCRSPLQYRHIAAGNPPKAASHIASVAHVPIYEIGSKPVPVPENRINHRPFRHPGAAGSFVQQSWNGPTGPPPDTRPVFSALIPRRTSVRLVGNFPTRPPLLSGIS